jgi:hypothetical protein
MDLYPLCWHVIICLDILSSGILSMCKIEFKELGFQRMETIHLTPDMDQCLYTVHTVT